MLVLILKERPVEAMEVEHVSVTIIVHHAVYIT